MLYWLPKLHCGASFVDTFLVFMFHICLYYTVLSVPHSLEITCWERADLLALFCHSDVSLCFCHFPKWCLESGVVLECIDS